MQQPIYAQVCYGRQKVPSLQVNMQASKYTGMPHCKNMTVHYAVHTLGCYSSTPASTPYN